MISSMFNPLRGQMFSVGDVVEYSDLSPWEPVTVTKTLPEEYEIEFLDHDKMIVHETEIRPITWDTIRDLDNYREECVKEIQTLRQTNGHLQARVERYKKAWLQSQSQLARYTTTQA